MDRHGQKGSITVFLSLTCILFLSLICAAVESARVQGARAQAANITGMGNFSLLGEFERGLLARYDLFGLDGAYGSGSFQIEKVNQRLQEFVSYNANPEKDLFSARCFDPWKLELTDSSVSGYALLTDERGEPFFQQAVSYMKANAAAMTVGKLLDYARTADEIRNQEQKYKENQAQNDSQISELEQERQQRLQEIESEAAQAGSSGEPTAPEPENNILEEIARLRKKGTLELVTWGQKISEKKLTVRSLPSKKARRKGNMRVEKKHSGLVANVIFREYLMTHFPEYLSSESGRALDYQLEYILGGKDTDKKNLKHVVNRLLLLREGMNYLYCAGDAQISAQAEGLAVTLTGFLGIPPLTAATKHALLLAWAYAESLVDVRILLDGGKVPVYKDAATWSLPVEKLGRITEVLREGAKGKEDGLSYRGYLRILLNLGSVTNQRMRALDMIQMELQGEKNTASFRAEDCIVAVHTGTEWSCAPVFARLPLAALGTTPGKVTIRQEGSISY